MDFTELYAINKREAISAIFPVREDGTHTVIGLYNYKDETLAQKDYGVTTRPLSEIVREFAQECGRTAEMNRYLQWAQDNHHTGLTWDEIITSPAPARLQWYSIWGEDGYARAERLDYKHAANDEFRGLR